MKCPFCGFDETQVKDSRNSEDGTAIRRRRLCPECGSRFTTLERVQLREITVLKRNGSRETFDRDKLARSIILALRKRPVEQDRIEKIVTGIQRQLEISGETDIPSSDIGDKVMEILLTLDKVAYIRYASVYQNFGQTKDFKTFLDRIVEWTKSQGDENPEPELNFDRGSSRDLAEEALFPHTGGNSASSAKGADDMVQREERKTEGLKK